MTLNIALLIKANAAQAKGEVTSLATVTKAFGTQTRNAGNDTRQAAAAMAAYEARIAAMEAELRQLIATQGKTKPAFDSGAQSVGNMVAQFNDIGVMLAAGQNPLQLAIQQGTQITQGFGNRGAAGAVQLLKQGFVSMLSPLNLGTIAILAGGAALVQWGIGAFGAGQKTGDFAAKVDDAQSAIDALNGTAYSYADGGLEAIRRKYGEVNLEVLALVRNQQLVAVAEATERVQAALSAVTSELGDGFWNGSYGEIRRIFDVGANEAQVLYGVLSGIGDLDISAQERVLENMVARLSDATSGFTIMTSEQAAMLRVLAGAQDQMRQLAAAQKNVEENTFSASNAVDLLYGGIVRAAGEAQNLARSGPNSGWMNAAITGVNGLIGRLQVALGVKNALGGGVSAPSALTQEQLDRQSYGLGQVAVRDAMIADRAIYGGDGNGLTRDQQSTINPLEGTVGAASGGGGGGGGAVRAERDAVAELIAKLREEQAVLAELDPVKAQMLRYREQLSTATAAERAEVEALIMVREREKAMDQLGEFGANSVVDLLKTIGREGETANDVFKKIIRNLADMGIQALIVGKGPLAQLFGISGNIFQGGGRGGGGGWLGNLVSGLFGGGGGTGTLGLPAFADGMIFGAGGGRDDKILARVSAGESIINARATARHRPLLERINAGLPRFANGVIGGGGALSSAAADGAQAFNFNINVTGARGNGEIIDMVHQGVAKGIEIFQREVLPTAVIRISRNPHERGRG